MINIIGKTGQMGNRLFLFAHIVAYALQHNLSVSNLAFDEYGTYFEGTQHDVFSRFPSRKSGLPPTQWRRRYIYKVVIYLIDRCVRYRVPLLNLASIFVLAEGNCCRLTSPEFQNAVRSHSFLFLVGWRFQDLALFDRHADQIRRFFQPVSPHKEAIKALIQSCRADADILIGIHIRRGDYKEFVDGQYFFSHEVYADLMRRAKALFPLQRVHFLICSNEPVPVEFFLDLDYSLGSNHLVGDMYSLAGCDYLLGPESTYSMWASFYGQVPLYQVYQPEKALTKEAFVIRHGKF